VIAQIRPTQLSLWLQAQSAARPLILDVREPWELALAHVMPWPDAPSFDVLNMPMQAIATRLAELPPDRAIACLCHHGVRSQHVAAFLLARGFENVVNIAGGIHAWSQEIDPNVALY